MSLGEKKEREKRKEKKKREIKKMNTLATMLLFPVIGENFDENVPANEKDVFLHSYLVSYKCLYSLHAALMILDCKQDAVDLSRLTNDISFDSPGFDFYLRPFYPFGEKDKKEPDVSEEEEQQMDEKENLYQGAVGFCVHLLQAIGNSADHPPRVFLFDSPPPSFQGSKVPPKPEFLNIFGQSMGPFGFFHASLYHFREGCLEPDRCMVCTMFRSTLRTMARAISSRFRDILNFYFRFEQHLSDFYALDFIYANHANYMLDFCRQMNTERKILLKLNARYRDIILSTKKDDDSLLLPLVKSNETFQRDIHQKMYIFEDARSSFCKMISFVSEKRDSLVDLIKKQDEATGLIKFLEAENRALRSEIQLLEDETIPPPPPLPLAKRKRKSNKQKKIAAATAAATATATATAVAPAVVCTPSVVQDDTEKVVALMKTIFELQQQNREFALRHSMDQKKSKQQKVNLLVFMGKSRSMKHVLKK